MRARTSAVRTLIVSVVALAFGAALPVSPVLAWDASCSSSDACVWRDGPFGLPLAAQVESDNDYSGNTYPNSSDSINDTVSSIRNRKTAADIVWFFNGGPPGGNSFCSNAGWEAGQLNSHNDQYSAHTTVSGSTC